MSSLAVQSPLDANLTSLMRGNGDVVELIRNVQTSSVLSYTDSPQGVPAGMLDGRQLCSRHRPLDEAARLIERVDLIEHAVVVVLGFGMGYHVKALAERMGKAGVILLYEPDVALARAVLEHVDHSRWLEKANVVWITNAADRSSLATKLKGAESILAQGVTFVEHPASRDRLGSGAAEFSRMLSEFMTSAKTTLLTTLVRSVDTIRNLVLNLDHYAAGLGIQELRGIARNYPAVVVSAGPSLRRNMHLLSQPGVRDRCVIIAVQTVLKPLLAAGIKPHFVTALDYHEISRRFYESLTADDVAGVTLVAEPKVHPVVLDLFPGTVRCCASTFLDALLGPDLQRDMGELPAGATVAHLAVYLAHHLGCNPIAMIGQDLGFTDGLYYGPGTAIDEVWAPELNSFNTMEMMQWQRIVRHRGHLHKTEDQRGRSMYSDAQMMTYLQQFERDFSRFVADGIEIIDATEGGVAKQHATQIPLAEVLTRHATRVLPDISNATSGNKPTADRITHARKRVSAIRRDMANLRETARRTQRLIDRMLADQDDQKKMAGHFAKLKQFQQRVAQKSDAFQLLEYLNQFGAFKRRKADRRLHMHDDLTPMQRQRLELQRDQENVSWINDAAQELIGQLAECEALLDGRDTPSKDVEKSKQVSSSKSRSGRVAALMPVDPHRSGLGVKRSLDVSFQNRPVIQATLERLSRSLTLERIILIVPRSFDVEPLLDRRKFALPIDIELCDGESPFGPEREAIAAARAWCDTSWRGGIAGMSVYDEVLCPSIMHAIMQRRNLDAALLVAPDWPLVDVGSGQGCDAVVQRFFAQAKKPPIVFTQAPPGLCGCLVSTEFMKELVRRNRLSTIGGQLVYQPHVPRADPVGTDANVQIDHDVRSSPVRATFDSPRWRDALSTLRDVSDDMATLSATLRESAASHNRLPQHVILELTAQRQSCGLFAERLRAQLHDRPPMSLDIAERMFEQLAAAGDAVVTLGGFGDPLLHEQCEAFVRSAKAAGVRAVHVRTELLCERDVLDRLLDSGVDVISVDLHADCAATYQHMMGVDQFSQVIGNIEHLVAKRQRFTDHQPAAALALPWIVPRLQRCEQTYDDLESFFDRWQHLLGAAAIEGGPGGSIEGDELEPAITPPSVIERELQRRMLVRSDGSVPVCEMNASTDACAGHVHEQDLTAIWQSLLHQRANSQPPARICFA